ncbi:MAG: hypothetical protein WC875_05170 [Candidatus Absconditabacterales bacterium]|jgi:hypothetical protein
MKWYLAKEKFEYTNAVGQIMTAKAGDAVAICLFKEEKALKKLSKIRELNQSDYEVKPMTTGILNGDAPVIKDNVKNDFGHSHKRGRPPKRGV